MGNKNRWTPEWVIQAGKELVTAVLGGFLVWYALGMASKMFDFVGDETKMSQAKDVLQSVLGLTGVVIGYYFGRMPADARATQAQQQANQEMAYANQVEFKAERVADRMDTMMAKTTDQTEAGMLVSMGEMQSLRDEIRGIKNPARDRRCL